MIYVVAFLAVVAGLYWAYKKMRGPLYVPGMVSSMATQDTFDDESLYSSAKTVWHMPGGVDLFYFSPSEKTSQRPVLAIHGGPSIAPSHPWKLCQSLPGVYLYHARGCGHSTRIIKTWPTKGMWPGMKVLEERLGIGAQVADVERIRRRLLQNRGDETMDLVGHSFGGLIATMYAAEFPDHVRSLTLLVPASVLTMPSKELPDFFTVVGDKIRQQGDPQHVEEYEAFLKRYMDFASLPQETDETLAQRQNEFGIHYHRAAQGEMPDTEAGGMTGGMACYANFLSLGMEHDYVPICKKLLAASDFPVSIVHAGDDLMPEGASRQYQQLFPNSYFEVIPNVGHFLYDHPRVAEIVQETMDRAK